MPDIGAIPNASFPEPRGVSTASSGEVYVANGASSGAWTTLQLGTVVSFADYNDLATATTPISVTGGAGYVYLTNDAAGSSTNTTYLQSGLLAASLWDTILNKFDWGTAGLALGDMVDIRLDLEVTTTGANQDFDIVLEMATDGTSYDIPFERDSVKAAATIPVNKYNGIYMGDTNTLNNRARFKIKSDANATVKVNGWYVKILNNQG